MLSMASERQDFGYGVWETRCWVWCLWDKMLSVVSDRHDVEYSVRDVRFWVQRGKMLLMAQRQDVRYCVREARYWGWIRETRYRVWPWRGKMLSIALEMQGVEYSVWEAKCWVCITRGKVLGFRQRRNLLSSGMSLERQDAGNDYGYDTREAGCRVCVCSA